MRRKGFKKAVKAEKIKMGQILPFLPLKLMDKHAIAIIIIIYQDLS